MKRQSFHIINCKSAKIIDFLAAHKANFNIKDSQGKTPFFMAVICKDSLGIELLLKRDAKIAASIDIHLPNNAGQTPFEYATRLGYTEIIKLLLEHTHQFSPKAQT